MKHLTSIFLVFLITSCSSSKVTVKKFSNESLENKLFYALPRNTVDVEIKLKKTTLTKGPSFELTSPECATKIAKRYNLEESDLIALSSNSSISTTIIEKDGFSFTEGAKSDTNKIFTINITPKFYQDNIVGLSFNQDWQLSEASIESNNKSFEIATSVASSLLGVIGNIPKSGIAIENKSNDLCLENYKKLDTAISLLEGFISEEWKRAYTAESFNARKAQLQKKIDEEFEKVLYSKKEKSYSVKFSFDLPNNFADSDFKNLFFINDDGTISINDTYKSQIRINQPDLISFEKESKSKKWYAISCNTVKDDVYSTIKNSINNTATETSLAFNIPATVDISFKEPEKNKIIALNRFKIAQFGSIGYLNKKLNKVGVSLDSITGSLVKVSGESKSVATSNISSVGDLSTKIKETFKKPTEVEELEKKAKILELKAKIKELGGED